MHTKAILFVIFFTATSASRSPASEGLDNEFSNVITGNLENKFDDLLKELQELVDKAVEVANHDLDIAKGAVSTAADKVTGWAKAALNSLQNKFTEALDALKKKAKDANVNIDSCLGQDEIDLVNLPTDAAKDLVKCVQGDVNLALDSAKDALNKIQKIVDDIAEIRQEGENCGSGWRSIPCYARLVVRVTEDIAVLPAEIAKDAETAVGVIEEVVPELEVCGTSAVTDCTSRGEVLLAKITACVAGKLVH